MADGGLGARQSLQGVSGPPLTKAMPDNRIHKMPLPKATNSGGIHRRVGLGLSLSAACIGLPLPRAIAEDATTRAIRKVMEENLAASDAEDLPRLMKTMSRESPNPERFIRETLKEWAAADTSTHLVELEVLKRITSPYARIRLPYATVRFVQEMTKSERAPGGEEPSKLSRMFGLDQEYQVVEFETLWKREGGGWFPEASNHWPHSPSRPTEGERTPSPHRSCASRSPQRHQMMITGAEPEAIRTLPLCVLENQPCCV